MNYDNFLKQGEKMVDNLKWLIYQRKWYLEVVLFMAIYLHFKDLWR